MSCPKCECKTATAATLTRGLAKDVMKKIAKDLRLGTGMTIARSEEVAMASILTKRPQLLVVCDGCKFEWLE
jgi:hypothetical protein